MHNERQHLIPSHFDLPSLDEIKLKAFAWASNSPAINASVDATIKAKKAIETSTGKKLTSNEIDSIYISNAKAGNKEVEKTIDGLLLNFKLILFVVVLVILFIKFK